MGKPPIEDMERRKFAPSDNDDPDQSPVMVTSKEFQVEYTTQAIGATSATKELSSPSRYVRLVSSVDCYLRFDDEDATTTDLLLKANVPESFPVVAENISVIRATDDGTLSIVNFY